MKISFSLFLNGIILLDLTNITDGKPNLLLKDDTGYSNKEGSKGCESNEDSNTYRSTIYPVENVKIDPQLPEVLFATPEGKRIP